MILPTRDDINAGVAYVIDEDWVDADKAIASGLPRAAGFAGLTQAAFQRIQKSPSEATLWMLLWSAFAAGWCAAHLSIHAREKVN